MLILENSRGLPEADIKKVNDEILITNIGCGPETIKFFIE